MKCTCQLRQAFECTCPMGTFGAKATALKPTSIYTEIEHRAISLYSLDSKVAQIGVNWDDLSFTDREYYRFIAREELKDKEKEIAKARGIFQDASKKATEAQGPGFYGSPVPIQPNTVNWAPGQKFELYSGSLMELIAVLPNDWPNQNLLLGRFMDATNIGKWKEGRWDTVGFFQHKVSQHRLNIKRPWNGWITPVGYCWHVVHKETHLQEWHPLFPKFNTDNFSIKLVQIPNPYPVQIYDPITKKYRVQKPSEVEIINQIKEKLTTQGEGYAWKSSYGSHYMLADKAEQTGGYIPNHAFKITWKEKK